MPLDIRGIFHIKGATQKIFLEFGLFFFYRNNNRQQPENCNRLLFFL